MKKMVLFASGNGSNVANIISYFKNKELVQVAAVFSNNPNAKVLAIAQNENVRTVVFDRNQLTEGWVLNRINEIQPDLIVLAGFLWKFPDAIIQQYPNKVINIHPALLPKYGGKGMYGIHVHQAILENKEPETGITVHFVNEHYDEGEFIFQQAVNIQDCQSPEEIANKVQKLEHEYFPEVIEKILNRI